MYGFLVFSHVLGATIWVGGHIILSFIIVPKALKHASPNILTDFESPYEKIAMPALIIQVLTGFMLLHRMFPDLGSILTNNSHLSHAAVFKLILLSSTILLALNARFRVIKTLSDKTLLKMAFHVWGMTFISILFVIAGLSFRFAWL